MILLLCVQSYISVCTCICAENSCWNHRQHSSETVS